MTLNQLTAFVLVARLGSVKAAATTLDVSEPAVSQALAALRKHFDDQLIVRGESGMELTEGGQRLVTIAAQIVGLGVEAESAVRSASGAPDRLRLVTSTDVAEFVAGPLFDAFGTRSAGAVALTTGVAGVAEMGVLVAQRLVDMAIGPDLSGVPGLVSERIFRCQLVVLGAPGHAPLGRPAQWHWCVGPSGTDPDGEIGHLLRALGVPDARLTVFPNQAAAWDAAARGGGVAPGLSHLAAHHLRRRELQVLDVPRTPVERYWYASTLPADRRHPAASALHRFLGTPEAMRLLSSPGSGVPASTFRPPVHVTIWS
ncbi:LysR family transcriptional regulator [Pseudonocardia humida]|uniref:LysR family transcriptional regulator n=1 Tax=Pseudonocardia humida TaxID=2800819 RepID=A0ABT0ZVL3_9PSEU|nr:LysR family transcriptional regulator [Pseudonocardia humida]MCO1654780.1 LysR family transcriptional regulator [Pseudonocardia humida]